MTAADVEKRNALFAADFKRLMNLSRERAAEVARQSIMAIGKSLVLNSPVGNPTLWKHPAPKGYAGGRFRANWQHGFNIRPSGTTDKIDPSGAATIEKLYQRVRSVGDGMYGLHFFANNLPYANMLEYGHHSSQVHPAGMVGVTMMEFHEHVLRQSKRVAAVQ